MERGEGSIEEGCGGCRERRKELRRNEKVGFQHILIIFGGQVGSIVFASNGLLHGPSWSKLLFSGVLLGCSLNISKATV